MKPLVRWLRIKLTRLVANLTQIEVPSISAIGKKDCTPATGVICYISGPISKGNRADNLFQTMPAHAALMQAGVAVVNPMLTMLLDFAWSSDFPHGLWLSQDYKVVERVDCVLRMPGDSLGADGEVEHALAHGKRVFYSVESLLEWVRNGRS